LSLSATLYAMERWNSWDVHALLLGVAVYVCPEAGDYDAQEVESMFVGWLARSSGIYPSFWL